MCVCMCRETGEYGDSETGVCVYVCVYGCGVCGGREECLCVCMQAHKGLSVELESVSVCECGRRDRGL